MCLCVLQSKSVQIFGAHNEPHRLSDKEFFHRSMHIAHTTHLIYSVPFRTKITVIVSDLAQTVHIGIARPKIETHQISAGKIELF